MEERFVGLESLRRPLNVALQKYTSRYPNLAFGQFDDFVATPDKPNSARTTIQVYYSSRPIGTLYSILFLPGDGTGDHKTFAPGTIHIPSDLRFKEKSDRVIPRSKDGMLYEAFFPFFSRSPTGVYSYGVSSFQILGIDQHNPPNLIRTHLLGLDQDHFNEVVSSGVSVPMNASYTTDSNLRFANPHAIFYDPSVSKDIAQVVGFLAITASTKESQEFRSKLIDPSSL